MKKREVDIQTLQRRSRRKSKIITLLFMTIAIMFVFPMVYADSVTDTVAAFLGVDLTNALVSGGSAAITSIAGIVSVYRIVKKPFNKSLNDAAETIELLKEKIELVKSGEISVTEAMDETKLILTNFVESQKQTFADLKDENSELRKQIQNLEEQINNLKTTFMTILANTSDLKEILLLIGSNLPELVENGIANKINKVGESTNENEY